MKSSKSQPKIVVFATGTKDGGGSGFENLVRATEGKDAVLDAEIVAVVSNIRDGGVQTRAEKLGVPFIFFEGPWTAEKYKKIVVDSGAEWAALSGWLKKVSGLSPQKTFNIHPALLSQHNGKFGGPGMYGHRVHEAVLADFLANGIYETGFSMHFVTDEYDRGPVFFEYAVPLVVGMDAEDIGKAVNEAEHVWQPRITNEVVHGIIEWDGVDPTSLVLPNT
ncbi:MAG: formyltransferase family protein [Minisyncoccia bacterium]